MEIEKILEEYKKILHKNKSGFVYVEWSDSLFISNFFGINLEKYIWDRECKLSLQKKIIKKFNKIIWVPGIWPCYSMLDIPSIFGVTVEYSKDKNNCKYKPSISDLDSIRKIKKTDLNYELIKRICDDYVFFHNNVSEEIKQKYEYLDGIAFTAGPLESAAIILGHENFLLNLAINPNPIFKILDLICEETIRWLKQQEKINGTLQRIYIPDHIPSLISKDMFNRLLLKYFKNIFSEFKYADIFYHNEGRTDHILEELNKLNIRIFNCGDVDLAKASDILKNTILMGNIDSNFIKNSNKSELIQMLKSLINLAKEKKMFISTSGGIHPDVPEEKIKFIANYVINNIK